MNFESSGDFPFSTADTIGQQVAVAIPESCADCGVQCELGAQLARMLAIKHMMTHVAESLIGDSGESFNAMVDESAPVEIADQIKQFARSSTATNLDEIDRDIDATKEQIKTNANSCSGPLKMRASKNDTTYTVSVCTSADQYDDSGASHLPTHIKTHKK